MDGPNPSNMKVMIDFLRSAPSRRPSRRAVAAWLRADRGDTLIEVMVAALLVALIAGAIFVGFGTVAHIAGGQRHEAEANVLAQQDEERLRGLTITELVASTGATSQAGAANYGNTSYPVTVDGDQYTVTSTAKFVSASTGNQSCSTNATDSADYVETASSVTWSAGTNDGRPAPVVEHSLIAPHVGGGLVIQVQNGPPNFGPVPNVTISVNGASTGTLSLTTDANGCAVFAGLPGGAYTVNWPSNYVSDDGATSESPIVVDGLTTTVDYQLGIPGKITANFQYKTTTGATATATDDTFVASPQTTTPPNNATYGTAGTYASSVSSTSSVFPLSGANYAVYAGTCTADAPPVGNEATVAVSPGSNPSVSVPEPAMYVDVYSGTPTEYNNNYNNSNPNVQLTYAGAWTYASGSYYTNDYNGDEDFDNTTGDSANVTFTGTSIQWIGSYASNHGKATVSLDGGTPTTVDTYAANSVTQAVLYSATGLTNTTHTLKITVAGTKNTNSSGYFIPLDALIVVTPTLMTSKPDITLTETDAGCTNNETRPPTQVPTASAGALANPGEPYGNFTVCADNGTSKNTATVANTSFAATGNTVNVYLSSGAPGLTSGTCT
jgi:Tfp pilus assembly protein PilE